MSLHKSVSDPVGGPASVWATGALCTHILQLWSLPALFFRHAGPYLILPAPDLTPEVRDHSFLHQEHRPAPAGSRVQLTLSDCLWGKDG